MLPSRRRAIVESFVDFLRLNSVSQEPDKVRVTGEWLAAQCGARPRGARARDGRQPRRVRRAAVPGATRTVLFYCHYDTKPIPLDGWLQPNPIEPVFRRGLAEAGAAVPWPTSPTTSSATCCSTRAAPRTTRGRSGVTYAIELMDAVGLAPREREVHLRRRGGDRQPVLRRVHRAASRPARGGRRDRDRRAQARERTPDDRRRRARRDEDRAGARGGAARPPLGQLRRAQPRRGS